MTHPLRFTQFVLLLSLGGLGLAAPGCGDTTSAAVDAAAMDASVNDTGTHEDSSTVDDAGIVEDTGTSVDGGTVNDTGANGDAGPVCEGSTEGSCAAGLTCDCCPAGGPLQHCTCSTPCASASDCTDPSRPVCQQESPTSPGFCAADTFTCCWLCL